MAALRAGESDPLVRLVDQLYSSDGQIELRRSNNCLYVSGLLSIWGRSLPNGRLCFTDRACSAGNLLKQLALSARSELGAAERHSVPARRTQPAELRSPRQWPKRRIADPSGRSPPDLTPWREGLAMPKTSPTTRLTRAQNEAVGTLPAGGRKDQVSADPRAYCTASSMPARAS